MGNLHLMDRHFHNLRLRLWRRYRRRWWWPWLPWLPGLGLPVAVAVVTAWMVGGQ